MPSKSGVASDLPPQSKTLSKARTPSGELTPSWTAAGSAAPRRFSDECETGQHIMSFADVGESGV